MTQTHLTITLKKKTPSAFNAFFHLEETVGNPQLGIIAKNYSYIYVCKIVTESRIDIIAKLLSVIIKEIDAGLSNSNNYYSISKLYIFKVPSCIYICYSCLQVELITRNVCLDLTVNIMLLCNQRFRNV